MSMNKSHRARPAVKVLVALATVLGVFFLSGNLGAGWVPLSYAQNLPAAGSGGYFQPPARSEIPKGPFGDSIKRGLEAFVNTTTYEGTKRYVGSGLTCANCHLDQGRKPNAAPMWAAWVLYPAYNKKNNHVIDMAARIQGCFVFSENAQASQAGHPPPPGDPVLTDMQAYMFWLAKGVPTGKKMAGQGIPRVSKPPKAYNRARGEKVYAANCATCHGNQGQGSRHADGSYAFPPLWGAHSYVGGGGMSRVDMAVAFIKANMPRNKPNTLSLQEAWDVAAFVNSHPRPSDPREK